MLMQKTKALIIGAATFLTALSYSYPAQAATHDTASSASTTLNDSGSGTPWTINGITANIILTDDEVSNELVASGFNFPAILENSYITSIRVTVNKTVSGAGRDDAYFYLENFVIGPVKLLTDNIWAGDQTTSYLKCSYFGNENLALDWDGRVTSGSPPSDGTFKFQAFGPGSYQIDKITVELTYIPPPPSDGSDIITLKNPTITYTADCTGAKLCAEIKTGNYIVWEGFTWATAPKVGGDYYATRIDFCSDDIGPGSSFCADVTGIGLSDTIYFNAFGEDMQTKGYVDGSLVTNPCAPTDDPLLVSVDEDVFSVYNP